MTERKVQKKKKKREKLDFCTRNVSVFLLVSDKPASRTVLQARDFNVIHAMKGGHQAISKIKTPCTTVGRIGGVQPMLYFDIISASITGGRVFQKKGKMIGKSF